MSKASEYMKLWRIRNPDKYRAIKDRYNEGAKEYFARYRNNRNRSIRQLIRQAREVPCMDCGVKFVWYIMEFDHVRGVKIFNISKMVGRGMKAVLEELAKCDVVCANCHRIRTFKRKQELAG